MYRLLASHSKSHFNEMKQPGAEPQALEMLCLLRTELLTPSPRPGGRQRRGEGAGCREPESQHCQDSANASPMRPCGNPHPTPVPPGIRCVLG